MYAAVIREGQLVKTPSGNLARVLGNGVEGTVHLRYLNFSLGEVELHPHLLTHVHTPADAGQPLEALNGAPELGV